MTKKKSKGNSSYDVGYRQPPRATQFKPGESGNTKGRPKSAKNFKTILDQELNTRVPVNEGGKRRKISKREVIAKRLVNKAAEGDHKATQAVLSEARSIEAEQEASGGAIYSLKPEDQPVMADIIKRIRSMDEPQVDGPPTDKTPANEPALVEPTADNPQVNEPTSGSSSTNPDSGEKQ